MIVKEESCVIFNNLKLPVEPECFLTIIADEISLDLSEGLTNGRSADTFCRQNLNILILQLP